MFHHEPNRPSKASPAWISLQPPAKILEEADAAMTTLTLSDGAKINLTISGEGRPVVFVHGWAMHGGMFEPQHDALSKNYQVISFDLRGHRHSASHDAAATVERLGADLVEIFEQLNLQEAVCVGWSMGAMVAWEAMTQEIFARRVSGLVIIDMSPRISNDASWQLGLSDGRRPLAALRAAQAMRQDWPAMVHQFVPRIFSPNRKTNHGVHIAEMIEEANALNAETMADLWESMAVQDFRKTIRLLNIPTLVIYGEQSQLYPEATSQFVASEIPNCEIASFPNSGHAPHLEEPDRFNERLITFIEKLSSKTISNTPFIVAAH
ncbi:MAG: alpha/beta hydrolase [Alphaproteobacteria bacterium]|nr:alpha/beta hydrolase [Alphaproteobacteria bacterium]